MFRKCTCFSRQSVGVTLGLFEKLEVMACPHASANLSGIVPSIVRPNVRHWSERAIPSMCVAYVVLDTHRRTSSVRSVRTCMWSYRHDVIWPRVVVRPW